MAFRFPWRNVVYKILVDPEDEVLSPLRPVFCYILPSLAYPFQTIRFDIIDIAWNQEYIHDHIRHSAYRSLKLRASGTDGLQSFMFDRVNRSK
jgi:hypothetical protein